MKRLLIATILCCLWTHTSQAESFTPANIFSNWPSFNLQTELDEPEKDMIEFEEADFDELKEKAKASNEPMIPLSSQKHFSEMVLLSNPDIKWRYFASAFSSKRYSGFSQGIGGTTVLIDNELLLDVQVEQVHLNSHDKYYRHYDGEKYRVNTNLVWQPTDNFSLTLGLGTWIDK